MSVVGIGLDLIEIEQFAALYKIDDVDLLSRCFTKPELADIAGSPNWVTRLAARFASKEAVLKVLGGLQQGTALTDVEIVLVDGRPELRLSGGAQAREQALGIAAWHISLSHTATTAAAVAVAVR